MYTFVCELCVSFVGNPDAKFGLFTGQSSIDDIRPKLLNTTKEHQTIPTFSTVSKNSDCSLQWWSLTKCVWEHKK